ncbi:hypothetical protein [Methylorubrum extorquens]|uniref:hypothetical protein n=1 Tax=Methylorubrum extorquens TaxID=408 RepID=UPI00209E7337|nr:hypothetical protein [Methylorubrum extorquens]MCP1540009.1 hypothetical protein [Methylorubrum extorquens]
MALSPAMMALVKNARNRYTRGNSKFVKIKEGRTRVRIISTEADGKFWQDLGVHWIKTELGGKPVAVVGCSDLVKDEPCPICTAIEKAMKAAVDDDQVKLVKEWKTKKSVLVKAIIRDGADASPDPQILEITPSTFGSIVSMIEEYGNETDPLSPTTGIDFVITRSGKGLDTEYGVIPALKSDPLTKDQVAKAKEINLLEAIEKEFFKGEETKALNAIGAASGITLAIAPPKRAAGLLTSTVATEDDIPEDPAPRRAAATTAPRTIVEEPIEAEVTEVKTAAPSKAGTTVASTAGAEFGAAVEDSELDSLLDGLDGI